MNYDQLRDALDGLHAYDTGCVSSGIKDEALRTRVITQLRSLHADEHRALLARLTVDMWLAPKAVAQGYGAEDAREFLNWCDDQGILISVQPEGKP